MASETSAVQKMKDMPVIVVLTKCDRVSEAVAIDDLWFLLGLEGLQSIGLRLEVVKVTSTTAKGYEPLIRVLHTCTG